MKLALLSCNGQSYSTRRLREAALQRGHKVKVLNTLKFAIDLDQACPSCIFARNAFLNMMRSCQESGPQSPIMALLLYGNSNRWMYFVRTHPPVLEIQEINSEVCRYSVGILSVFRKRPLSEIRRMCCQQLSGSAGHLLLSN